MTSPPTDLNGLTLPALYQMLAASGHTRRVLEIARDEDIAGAPGVEANGDITSLTAPLSSNDASAAVTLREPGIVCGLAVVDELLRVYGVQDQVAATPVRNDGDAARAGDRIATIRGDARAMLLIERPLLNIIGRLSGVATRTRMFCDAALAMTTSPDDAAASDIEPISGQVFDTRKTTPGLRAFEKYAVRCGGGRLHRYNLADAVLLKDNHLAGVADGDLAAFVAAASERARADRPLRFVEVEVDRLEQLDVILTLPPGVVDIVLLDNMPPDSLRHAARRRDAVNPTLQLEASGGVTLDTIGAIARTGVQRISVGSITHGARSLDVGLDAGAE